MDKDLIDKQLAALKSTLKKQNKSEKVIQERLNLCRKFLMERMKKSPDNSENDAPVISPPAPKADRCQSSHTPKTASHTNRASEDQTVAVKNKKSPKSPVKEAQTVSTRADGDSGISSDRKSPLGVSRGLSNDSVTQDSPVRRKAVPEQPLPPVNGAVRLDAGRSSRAKESTRPIKRKSSSSSDRSVGRSQSRSLSASRSRSRSRSRSGSGSRSRSRSRSKRRSNKKHRKGKKRRKRHHRHGRRRSDHRSRSSRSPSYSRYRSRSRSRSRRGRRRRHRRSRSRSRSAAPYSSYSSPSRSPSIRRRPGSPSHLDRRRITSARKRPVPYLRKSASSGSGGDLTCGGGGGGGGLGDDPSGWRSRRSRSPSSECLLRHRLNNLARRRRQLTAESSGGGGPAEWLGQQLGAPAVPSLMQLLPNGDEAKGKP